MYFSTVAATLGVKDAVVKNALSIYPNPVRSGSNIMISSQVKSVEIYNMNGQLVRTSTSQSVSSQGLTSGLYLVKATDSKGSVQTTKLIVK
ncbi:T9SS type A sorting domain-containing protein [Halpernia sp. GG3]